MNDILKALKLIYALSTALPVAVGALVGAWEELKSSWQKATGTPADRFRRRFKIPEEIYKAKKQLKAEGSGSLEYLEQCQKQS